ncbi:MAG: aminopeptidase P N-terminal domain-containing protein [Bdellovibrionales bacterium]|nr:aminopeptidase P N-terminal domain-containing protein [Bdellovibrionales bacterium]
MRKSAVPPEVLKARRRQLGALIPGCALVLPAWPEQYRNADMHYNYRPESNLYYLTGYDEPECCLVFRPGKTPETVMFVREKNVERETWDGFRFGVDGAKQVFGYDAVYPYSQFTKVAPELLRGCERIYYSMFRNREFDVLFGEAVMGISGWRPRYGMGLPPIEDANSVVGELRMRKDETEIEMMRKAALISAEAHIEMMKATKPGITERYLHGVFLKEIMERGATTEAYGGIVATGNNATTLHYRFNESTLESGQVLLSDCGAEYQWYSGDITRCWPVNGRFSTAHKRVYEKVLQLQKELIGMVKPGLPHMDLQKRAVEGSVEILLDEKILTGTVEENIKAAAHAPFYPHGVSHLLGLDTHDSGVLMVQGKSRPLEAGWALTIEPGLYFPANNSKVPDELKGLGIRIEDDILVTPEGNENMTRAVPKDAGEVEALVGANYK